MANTELLTFDLTEDQKDLFKKSVVSAREFLLEKNDWRLNIAAIYCELHKKIFGNKASLNIENGRFLRMMFADELGIHLRTLEQWVDVKLYIIDSVAEAKEHSFDTLYQACLLVKMKNMSPITAIDKIINRRQSPSLHRLMLMERYSSNLLSSVRKFKMGNIADDRIEEIRARLRECLEYLE